jgi:hypothetical protein
MEEDTKEMLRVILQAQRDQRQETVDLNRNLARLVRELETDERREDRDGERQERERERLDKSLEDQTKRIENIGASLRDLPDRLLIVIEKKIYELRVARWEALQAGVPNEPAPLMPAPTYREPTGRIRALSPRDEDDDESLAPTRAQQRWLWRTAARQWTWFRWTLPAWGAEAVHRIYDVVRHAVGH